MIELSDIRTSGDDAAVAVERVRKAYGATVAVDDVSFSIRRGSVHALLGENGAGKSTIVKLLSGLAQPDAGGFRLSAQPVRFASPRDAHAHGIQTAFQEMTLVRDLTVLDNMLLPKGPSGPFGDDPAPRGPRRGGASISPRSGSTTSISTTRSANSISPSSRRSRSPARSSGAPRILLLDEPTSTLSGRDVDWLGGIIAEQRAKGVTTVFISHRLREVREFCDTMTVLRNGRHIATDRSRPTPTTR